MPFHDHVLLYLVFIMSSALELLPPKTFPSESYSCKNLTWLFNHFPIFLHFFVIICELYISLFLVLSNATETLHKSHILFPTYYIILNI